jgi:hypothetical protein
LGKVQIRGEGYKERAKESEYGGSILYSCMKNRTMKPTENVLRRGSRN